MIIENGRLLSVDIVCIYNGYHADQARPFLIGDRIDEDYKINFEKSVTILNETLNVIKIGVSWEEAFNKAVETAEKLNVSDTFMVNFSNIKFVGHGIGIEVDEFPFLAKGFKYQFEENMVFAFEPKIFVKGKGVVGIENTYRVTGSGVEKLTPIDDKIISRSHP
jgi:Xaa-Pro dipeptidase